MLTEVIRKFLENITAYKVWLMAATVYLVVIDKIKFTALDWVAIVALFIGGRVGEYFVAKKNGNNQIK